MALPVVPTDFEATFASDDWADWRWQARHAVTNLAGLEARLRLTPGERAGIARAEAGGFPISVTPYYLSLVDPADPACPIRRQVVPRVEEGVTVPGDLRDPLGEEDHEVAPNLVRRYPDRVLLLATDRCAVYCRFCTRSRMVGDGGGARSMDVLAPALDYIRRTPEIRDVIVSGGDPMVMGTSRITRILAALKTIPHLATIRLATRAPVTIPQRVTRELCAALRDTLYPSGSDGDEDGPGLWVMTHFNHPKELTREARRACARLVDHGIPVMNQSVLLAGVNDDEATLEELFRGLVKARVRPYYLLQADPVRGTSHLRTPLRRGVELMDALQGRVSGIALPKLIVDTPHGRGKVPVQAQTVVREAPGVTTLRTFRGEHVEYVDPPRNPTAEEGPP